MFIKSPYYYYYFAIESGFRVSIRVLGIRGFCFGDRLPPESVFGTVSGSGAQRLHSIQICPVAILIGEDNPRASHLWPPSPRVRVASTTYPSKHGHPGASSSSERKRKNLSAYDIWGPLVSDGNFFKSHSSSTKHSMIHPTIAFTKVIAHNSFCKS